MNNLRSLPSIDQLLRFSDSNQLIQKYSRPLTVDAFRFVLDEIRRRKTSQNEKIITPNRQEIFAKASKYLEDQTQRSSKKVINATGVIIHTNLGRANLSQEAIQAVREAGINYTSLEYDLEAGKRGMRGSAIERILVHLTGAESAMAVNNNAAAILLVTTALARKKKAIISRTQLVEIGGNFRIPDVLAQSGAHIIEIGTTNQVHLEDYQQALEEGARVVIHAHSSNFKLIGFTSEPTLMEMSQITHLYDGIMIDDLGSGALLDTSEFGLAHEPTIQESINAGSDIVCFSGDKLLGGPQAGIIVGKKALIMKIRKNPLARAVRMDKLCLAALESTLLHYLKNQAIDKIPIWKMISMKQEDIEKRARKISNELKNAHVIPGFSTIGGGSLPGETIPTFLLAIKVIHPESYFKALRKSNPPVVARIIEDQVCFDLRTVFPEQDIELASVIRNVVG